MEAVILSGVQGSGKTTFYLQQFLHSHVRISLDMLRTRHREQLLLAACLQARQAFVIDNTNALASDRARYIAPARAAGFAVVAYWLDVNLRDVLRQNNQRQGQAKIPAVAVAATFKKLQVPAFEEGFDGIFRVVHRAPSGFEVMAVGREGSS